MHLPWKKLGLADAFWVEAPCGMDDFWQQQCTDVYRIVSALRSSVPTPWSVPQHGHGMCFMLPPTLQKVASVVLWCQCPVVTCMDVYLQFNCILATASSGCLGNGDSQWGHAAFVLAMKTLSQLTGDVQSASIMHLGCTRTRFQCGCAPLEVPLHYPCSKCNLLCFFLCQDMPIEMQPQFVLDVEKQELYIHAGLQDRVIQIYEGLVHMDFSKELFDAQGHGMVWTFHCSLM